MKSWEVFISEKHLTKKPKSPKWCYRKSMKTLRRIYTLNFLSYVFRLAKIKEWVDTHDSGAVIIPLSGALEYKVTSTYSSTSVVLSVIFVPVL